jgi:hypothetical protein
VSASVGTTVAAVGKIRFGHYPVAIFHVKIFPLLQFILVSVRKKVIEISHSQIFFKSSQIDLSFRTRIAVFAMGVEKDYLMRQLMMLFEVIQKILRHRRKGEDEEAEKQIQFFYEYLKIDEDVEKLSVEALIDLLEKDKNLDDKRLDFFRKSYFILQKVERESISFSMDRQMKIAELSAYLN